MTRIFLLFSSLWLLALSICNAQKNKVFLEDKLSNALISDLYSNVDRNNPIMIIEYDVANNRIRTNYDHLEQLKVRVETDKGWFVTQSEDSRDFIAITEVDIQTGWISLEGEGFDLDQHVEFFNPLINYQIINNGPLLDPYPEFIEGDNFNYIQSGGIFQKEDSTFVLLTPVVYGNHDKRSIYFATSKDLHHWEFHEKAFLTSNMIPFARPNVNVFTTGNPLQMEDGNLLFLLAVEQNKGEYASAFMIVDENLNINVQPQLIKFYNLNIENSLPLSITKFNNQYRILIAVRNPELKRQQILEITTSELLATITGENAIFNETTIIDYHFSSGYLNGKIDDISCLKYQGDLYIIIGSEEKESSYLTFDNRVYGTARLEGEQWIHDKKSPTILNPIGYENRFPEYMWATDHLGGFVSPIIFNEELFIFMSFGSDNPDYYLTGIKIKL